MSTLFQDVRFAARNLIHSPKFTLLAGLTIAVAIGATTAVFSVVNALLLQPLPYPNAKQLAAVWEVDPISADPSPVAPANFLDWQLQSEAFEGLAAIEISQGFNLTGRTSPERVEGARATSNLFSVLGVSPLLGREFTPDEDRLGAPRVVLVGHSLWMGRLGGNVDVLGQNLTLDGRPYAVVGVMPEGFCFPQNIGVAGRTSRCPDVWVPMAFFPNEVRMRSAQYLAVVGRLKPDSSLHQAQAEMDGMQSRIATEHGRGDIASNVALVPLQEELVGGTSRAILVLFAAVTFLLAIACSNVAGLLVARSLQRRREIAIRSALGAARLRLVRQLLTESVLLAFVGAVVGLALAHWCVSSFVHVVAAYSPVTGLGDIGLDVDVLGFGVGVSLIAGLLFGLGPALGAVREDPAEALKQGALAATAGSRGLRVRNLLVSLEVALAVVLLSGAGMLIRSLQQMTQETPGFDAQNLITAQVWLPITDYAKDFERVEFYRRLFGALERLAEAESVSAIHTLPVTGGSRHVNVAISNPQRGSLQGDLRVQHRAIMPSYFQTMRIPLRQGRVFEEKDDLDRPLVAIINDTMARLYWPNGGAVGEELRLDFTGWTRTVSVVGIVGDVKQLGLATPSQPEIYVPYFQTPSRMIHLMLRTPATPAGAAGAIRQAVREADPNVPVSDIRSMDEVLADSVQRLRLTAWLLAAFSLLGLLLAVVGLYSVVSNVVNQRRKEIGIRVALGATKRQIALMMMRRGAWAVGGGIAVGLIAAWAVSRLLSSLLYGVAPGDPLTLIGVTALLTAAALVACYIPTWRATQVDPATVLRDE